MSYKHNSWSISTQSHFIKSNTFKKRKHVRFGGNCRDPLNLNELIQKSKQSITNNDNIDMNSHGNDRLVEILLQPDIYDPLCLDISSYNNENSIKFTSINQHTNISTIRQNFQPIKHDQQIPTKTKQHSSINRY
ncbi:unnamed protein product [Rotaria sordida]|uniref:Uncharacterized protein n=1 Tax=Rotaria sordida TaxID=392033 RepID=A0A818S353_9BILA|nr:unnamed protein product [Rotaria sordida]